MAIDNSIYSGFFNNYNYGNYNSYSYGSSANTSSATNIYNLLSDTSSYSNYYYGDVESGQGASKFIYNGKISADELKTVLYDLVGSSKSSGTYSVATAASSNEDVMKINTVDSKKATSMSDIEVEVLQIAQAQVNEGNSLDASAKAVASGFTQGANTLDIEVGSKKYSVEFNVTSSDTNESVQQKIASAINSKSMGLKASVAYDSENGKTTLSVQSTSTGVNTAGQDNFKITGGTGNLLELTGIGNVTQKAQDAQYRLNSGNTTGYLRTSKTNNIDIGNGITATIKDAGKATAKMKRDTLGQINATREMVNQYNSLLEAARGNSGDPRTDGLINQLTSLTGTYSSGLNKIGISTNSSGYLQIDEDKMKSAAESGDLEKFFKQNGTNTSFGFANRLTRVAEDVSKNATSYVSQSSIQNINFTSNQMNQYNKLMNTGLLFDLFI